MKWRSAHTNTILFKKGSLAKITTRCTSCHSMSSVVTCCHSRCHLLSVVGTCCSTHCHSLSFVVTRCTTRCHSLYHSLSLDVPLLCLFINNLAFLLSNISTFDACFFKKFVQISHVSVKLVITIEKKNGWNLNTSNFSTIKWMRWKLSNFLKYTVQFLHFHLIESI